MRLHEFAWICILIWFIYVCQSVFAWICMYLHLAFSASSLSSIFPLNFLVMTTSILREKWKNYERHNKRPLFCLLYNCRSVLNHQILTKYWGIFSSRMLSIIQPLTHEYPVMYRNIAKKIFVARLPKLPWKKKVRIPNIYCTWWIIDICEYVSGIPTVAFCLYFPQEWTYSLLLLLFCPFS